MLLKTLLRLYKESEMAASGNILGLNNNNNSRHCTSRSFTRVKTWASWKGYDSGELGEAHEDVLIVAGDISSSLERIAETLADLKERYDEV